MDTKIKRSGPGRPVKPAPRGKKRVQVSMILSAEIKTRVDQEAKRSGRTFSQAGEWLIERALSLDAVLKSMNRSLSGLDRENFEMEMRRRGYTPVHGPGGGWLPPEAPVERSGFIEWTEEEQPK